MVFDSLFNFGPVSTLFFVWLAIAAACAVAAGDWRLRSAVGLFTAVWLITFVPQTELLASAGSFVVLSRLQVRRRGEQALAWWLVPVLLAEAGILASHFLYLAAGYDAYWIAVQALYAAQLTVLTVVGARRVRRRIAASKANKLRGFALRPS